VDQRLASSHAPSIKPRDQHHHIDREYASTNNIDTATRGANSPSFSYRTTRPDPVRQESREAIPPTSRPRG
jgi:hypothetical protein